MQVSVNISSDMLKWIVSQASSYGFSDTVRDYLEKWQNGNAPTFNQIEKVSKSTGIPLGYFIIKKPPVENITLVNYRTIDSEQLSNPSRNLIDTLHDMDLVQEWVREYQIANGNLPCAFVGLFKNETKYTTIAENIRNLLNIKIDWYNQTKTVEESFNFLRAAISNLGVVVMMNGVVGNNTHRPLDIEEFRAFAVVDEYAPLIFINANDSINGRLFSLVHEFVHICKGENSLYNDMVYVEHTVQPIEILCNAVAAEILVPHNVFITEWNNTVINQDNLIFNIDQIAKKFKCGTMVIARRAYDNGFIDYSTYQQICKTAINSYNRNRKKKKEEGGGGDYYKTLASRLDRRFLDMVVGSVRSGTMQYTDAFRLTNTSRATFDVLIQKISGGVKK